MYAVTIRPMVQDSVVFLHASLQSGKRILVEGANGVMLDVDFGKHLHVDPYIFVFVTSCQLLFLSLKYIENPKHLKNVCYNFRYLVKAHSILRRIESSFDYFLLRTKQFDTMY